MSHTITRLIHLDWAASLDIQACLENPRGIALVNPHVFEEMTLQFIATMDMGGDHWAYVEDLAETLSQSAAEFEDLSVYESLQTFLWGGYFFTFAGVVINTILADYQSKYHVPGLRHDVLPTLTARYGHQYYMVTNA